MRKIISTWIYLDSKEEESYYPQVGGNSASIDFQAVYWKCIVVFFETSLRYNRDAEHILFTNSDNIPDIDGFNINSYLLENSIKIFHVQNKYKVPDGYYNSWNNQFFEFSIIEKIKDHLDANDLFCLLDSDCIFTRGISDLFSYLSASKNEALTYTIHYPETFLINGTSRSQMQAIFKEFDIVSDTPPVYCAGEILFTKGSLIKKIASDFPVLWDNLLKRFTKKEIKFNEEAQVLTLYYYKYNAELGALNNYIKRCWTNPFIYRNISKNDYKLHILHIPGEKKYGINSIFKQLTKSKNIKDLDNRKYQLLVKHLLSPNKYISITIKKILNKILPKRNRVN